MKPEVKLWLMDHGDGVFSGSVFEAGARQLMAKTEAADSYTVTLEALDERPYAATFWLHRTPQPGNFPDLLEGHGTVHRTGSDPCTASFALTGLVLPDEATCSDDPKVLQPCADVLGWQWHQNYL